MGDTSKEKQKKFPQEAVDLVQLTLNSERNNIENLGPGGGIQGTMEG